MTQTETTQDWTLTVLNNDVGDARVSVKIGDSRCPKDAEGQPDYSNADWPSDDEVTEEACRVLGRCVEVCFWDTGDGLDEGIYECNETGRNADKLLR